MEREVNLPSGLFFYAIIAYTFYHIIDTLHTEIFGKAD